MPGETSGEVRPTSSGSDAASQEAKEASLLRRPVRLRLASLAFGEASSGYAGQTKTVEKERCGEVRCAHERREREREKKPVRLVMKLLLIRRKPLRSTVTGSPSSEKSTHPTASGPPRSSGDLEAVLGPSSNSMDPSFERAGRTDPRSGTKNGFLGERRAVQRRTISFALSYLLPANPNLGFQRSDPGSGPG